jgi:hypothetical protein
LRRLRLCSWLPFRGSPWVGVNVAEGVGANIAKIEVDLPRRLPARLTTLQQACTDAQFEANPAGCPAASIVGTAMVHTPILAVPLEGPVYFVSHGGAKFPDLVIVLQGYGVTVELHGETFISKGITSSTFNSIPDVPFISFELILPQGPYSALAANGNLCQQFVAVDLWREPSFGTLGTMVGSWSACLVVQWVCRVSWMWISGWWGVVLRAWVDDAGGWQGA